MSALKPLLWNVYLAKLAHMSPGQKNDFLPGERDGAEREVKVTETKRVRARNESVLIDKTRTCTYHYNTVLFIDQ